MRWLLFFVTISASADCTSRVLYRFVDGAITNAVVDDGALYVSLIPNAEIERIDLASGESTLFSNSLPVAWDVQNGFLATASTLGLRDNDVAGIRIHDGYIYWVQSDGVLRRMLIGSNTREVLASGLDDFGSGQFAIFEDRVVFISDGKLFSKPLSSGIPVLILAQPFVASIDAVAADSILITTEHSDQLFHDTADVLRVTWNGASAETIYETSAYTYHNPLIVSASAAGATTYIARLEGASEHSSLIAVRGGVARELLQASGPLEIIRASEDAVTFLEWGIGTGMHWVVQQCAETPRVRAVR